MGNSVMHCSCVKDIKLAKNFMANKYLKPSKVYGNINYNSILSSPNLFSSKYIKENEF